MLNRLQISALDLRLSIMAAVLIVMAAVFHALTGNFLTPENLYNIAQQTAVVGIVAAAVALIIVARQIPEQRAVREVEEEKKKEAAVKRAEQQRKDKALLNTYQNIDDLESKRQRALLQVEREMKDAERRVSFLEKQEKEIKQEEEFYKKTKMPLELKRKLDENEGALRAERLLMTSKKDEITQVNLRFDEDKKRFMELTGGAAKAALKK